MILISILVTIVVFAFVATPTAVLLWYAFARTKEGIESMHTMPQYIPRSLHDKQKQ